MAYLASFPTYYRILVENHKIYNIPHLYSTAFSAHVGVTPSEFRKDAQYWENYNDGLSCAGENAMIC